jgi:NADH:ubiquinone oxidoreductase subunit 6 (subunit J)
MQIAAFSVLAVLAAASGYAVFVVDSMARASYLLAASFVFGASELLLLHLDYLAIVTVAMMFFEMSMMAVFMIMYMMNPAGLMPMSMLHNPKGSVAISLGTFALLALGIVLVPWPHRRQAPLPDPTRSLGNALMGGKMLVMIFVGVLLLATMVATIVLATARGRYDRFGDRLDRPSANDPIRGGVGR